MISVRLQPIICSPRLAGQFGRTVSLTGIHSSILGCPAGLRVACAGAAAGQHNQAPRYFSSTPASRLRDFFPSKETELIKTTPTAWRHHGWTEEQMLGVAVAHRKPETTGDKVAWRLFRFA